MSRNKIWIIAAVCIAVFAILVIAAKVFASDSCGTQIQAGTPVTLTATPCPDSYFAGWSSGPCKGSKSPACTFTMPAAPVNITAIFNLRPGKARNLRITKGCGELQIAKVGD
jgi:hypothetical protein